MISSLSKAHVTHLICINARSAGVKCHMHIACAEMNYLSLYHTCKNISGTQKFANLCIYKYGYIKIPKFKIVFLYKFDLVHVNCAKLIHVHITVLVIDRNLNLYLGKFISSKVPGLVCRHNAEADQCQLSIVRNLGSH